MSITEAQVELAHALFEWPEWRESAACSGLDPTGDIFHPRRGELPERAKAICAGCPVRDECLEYALANVIRVGIWGGRSERWRRRERHQRMREAMGLERLPDRVPAEKRRRRRATFGCGCRECKALARQLVKAHSVAS